LFDLQDTYSYTYPIGFLGQYLARRFVLSNETTYRKKPDGRKRRKHLSETVVTGALAARIMPDGRRKIKLNNQERAIFSKSQQIETAVRLFLDIEQDHTWDEIGAELGISVMALKDLTKTQEFIDRYDQHFAELGHDPRLRSAQAVIVDLLPLAVRGLRELLTGGEVPASVRFRAIEKIIELNGIGPAKAGQMDRHELMEFLKGTNISLTQNNISAAVPLSPYGTNISAYVEGRFSDIEAHEMSARGAGREAPAPESDEESEGEAH
jgi:hypothetical protein